MLRREALKRARGAHEESVVEAAERSHAEGEEGEHEQLHTRATGQRRGRRGGALLSWEDGRMGGWEDGRHGIRPRTRVRRVREGSVPLEDNVMRRGSREEAVGWLQGTLSTLSEGGEVSRTSRSTGGAGVTAV